MNFLKSTGLLSEAQKVLSVLKAVLTAELYETANTFQMKMSGAGDAEGL